MKEIRSVLVVGGHSADRELMASALRHAGYDVRAVGTGEAALGELSRTPVDVDLVVLDVVLPGIDGWETFGQIRARSQVPVVFVTAVEDEQAAVRALGMGGDDCIARTVNLSVFLARVEAVLRRADLVGRRRTIHLSDAEVDLAGAVVWRDGERVPLTAGECRMLATLARRAPRFVTAEDLAQAANGGGPPESDDPARQVKIRISRLRRKIEATPRQPQHLLSGRGRGYRLALEENPS
jgi:DNA-binding response OmpR family regulator